MTVMKNREQCFLVLGRESVRLSELLGVPLSAEDDHQLLINREHSRKIGISTSSATASSLSDHRTTVIDRDSRVIPGAAALAFINKSPTAAFADGWMYYLAMDPNDPRERYTLTVLVQEKQSVVARDQLVAGRPPPKQHTADAIAQEYKKCQPADSHKFLFVFATDSARSTMDPALPHNVLLFSGDLLERALGRVAWFMRKHQLAASQVGLACGERAKRARPAEGTEVDDADSASANDTAKRTRE